MLLTPVELLQLFQPVHVDDGETRVLDRAEVTATSLHRQHTGWLSRERIGHVELRTGIAAAEVGDTQIGPKKVRAVAQETQLVISQLGRLLVIPQIFQVYSFTCLRHGYVVEVGRRLRLIPR